ncbi:MAG: DUF2852 domain-containing protein [Planktomarina sp.]
MTASSAPYENSHPQGAQATMGWLRKSEHWLDSRGKGAWIAAMVLGFVFIWPVGLAILAYMIWSKRMFSKHTNGYNSCNAKRAFRSTMRSSGNTAFDAYKADTLRRLEEEQASFEAYLERLRAAKDQAEFDQFMDEQAKAGDHKQDA